MVSPKLFFAAVIATFPVLVSANVKGYGIWYIRDGVQVGPSDLGPKQNFWLSAWINTTSPGEIKTAALSRPSGPAVRLVRGKGNIGVGFLSEGFTNADQLMSTFPGGSYAFLVNDGGTYSGQSARLEVHVPLEVPERQPMLSAASYTALQNLDPSQEVELSWGPWKSEPETEGGWTFFEIHDITLNKQVVLREGLPTKCVGVKIPAGRLARGHKFRFKLKFDVYREAPSDAFGGSKMNLNSGFETTGTFSTSG